MTQCPCGSGHAFEDCCGPIIAGAPAPTAEALMRSRYSAFVRDELAYLQASWHASTRPASLTPNEPGLKWLGLEVKRHAVQDDTHATVEFVARSKWGGRAQRMHELSRFVRENGQWFYVDGDLR